jgi:hypothetical protein
LGKFRGIISNLKESLKRGLETGEDEVYINEKKAKSNSTFLVPDLSHDEEENMINAIATRIKKMKMEIPAIMFLETFKPVNRLISQLYGFYAAPFFEIFGIDGYKYSVFFNNKKNLENLISKLKIKE